MANQLPYTLNGLYVIYTNLEASATLDSSNNEYGADLTLTAIADSSLIRYCTVQDVYDELDITETDLSAQRVIKVIQRSEARIDEHTQSKFTSTLVTEYCDFNQFNSVRSPEQLQWRGNMGTQRSDYMNSTGSNKFRLDKYPVISITSLHRNNASAATADNWDELTEQSGSGGDFEIDLPTGWITFVYKIPRYGKRAIKVVYNYGHSTTPKQVERLTVLLTVNDIVRMSASSSQFYDSSDISIGEISIGNKAGAVATYLRNLQEEIERAWRDVGTFIADIT
jgi:hypothetical protein